MYVYNLPFLHFGISSCSITLLYRLCQHVTQSALCVHTIWRTHLESVHKSVILPWDSFLEGWHVICGTSVVLHILSIWTAHGTLISPRATRITCTVTSALLSHHPRHCQGHFVSEASRKVVPVFLINYWPLPWNAYTNHTRWSVTIWNMSAHSIWSFWSIPNIILSKPYISWQPVITDVNPKMGYTLDRSLVTGLRYTDIQTAMEVTESLIQPNCK